MKILSSIAIFFLLIGTAIADDICFEKPDMGVTPFSITKQCFTYDKVTSYSGDMFVYESDYQYYSIVTTLNIIVTSRGAMFLFINGNLYQVDTIPFVRK